MNKFGLVSLSVLGTLGVCAGAVAIINTAPNTKGKLNVSFGDNQIIGEETPIVPDMAVPGDFSSELADRNYISVEYVLSDGTSELAIQRKDSLIDFDLIENIEGKSFVGFANANNEIVYHPSNNDVLHAVYVDDVFVNYTEIEDPMLGTSFVNTNNLNNFLYGGAFNNYGMISFGDGSNIRYLLVGLSESEDSIVPVTSFDEETTYYPIYYLEESNKIVSFSGLVNECIVRAYGDKAYSNVTIELHDATVSCLIKDVNSSFTAEISIPSSEYSYRVHGFSTSPDSIEMIDVLEMEENGTYYAVYGEMFFAEEFLSLNDFKALLNA